MSELSQTAARGIVERLGTSDAPLRAIGVSRDIDSPAVLVAFNARLSGAGTASA